ncbi:phosphoesterage [Salmonella phage SE_PL]|nr:serine/threonine-protein phosphatase [Salmonella phage 7t3]QIG62920.1 phosphoesterage [Salmonella phage SE_PL]
MNHYQKIVVPDDKELFIVGDLHGNADLYDRTLHEFGITDKDYVFSVGDVIDRGERSARLLFEFLFKPNRYMILGNHEHMCIMGETRRDFYHCHMQNGGDKFLDEVGESGIQFFRQYLDQLPLIIEIHHRGMKIGLVHGGVPLRYTDWSTFVNDVKPMRWDLIEEIIWDRKVFDQCNNNKTPNAPKINGIDYVISGHTGVVDPLMYGNRIWIDSQFLSGDLTFTMFSGNTPRHFRREHDEHSFNRFKR